MTPQEVTAALEWSRLQIDPAYDIKTYASKLGMPRTTYNSLEKRGSGRLLQETYNRIAEFRGLRHDWHQGKFPVSSSIAETRKGYGRTDTKSNGSMVVIPTVETPSIGRLTKGRLGDISLHRSNQPIKVPANMSGPDHIVAIADQDDCGEVYQEGWQLIFNTSLRGKVGDLVSVAVSEKESSLRIVAWIENRIMYKGLNGQKPLSRDQHEEEGLLVGWIAENRVGKFRGEYDAEGKLERRPPP